MDTISIDNIDPEAMYNYIDSLDRTRWKRIEEAPYYMVSDKGHVKSLERGVKTFNGKVDCIRRIPETILREKDIRGYKNVSLITYNDDMETQRRYTSQVHRLVLKTFNPVQNMAELQVNHIDLDKGNNRLENLEWVTPLENTIHAREHGHKRNQNGELNSMSVLDESQVIDIIRETNQPKPYRRTDQAIADEYGVSRKTITNIRNGIAWTHIDRNSIT